MDRDSYFDWESVPAVSFYTEQQKSEAKKILSKSGLNEAGLIDGDVPDWISSQSEKGFELISQ